PGLMQPGGDRAPRLDRGATSRSDGTAAQQAEEDQEQHRVPAVDGDGLRSAGVEEYPSVSSLARQKGVHLHFSGAMALSGLPRRYVFRVPMPAGMDAGASPIGAQSSSSARYGPICPRAVAPRLLKK